VFFIERRQTEVIRRRSSSYGGTSREDPPVPRLRDGLWEEAAAALGFPGQPKAQRRQGGVLGLDPAPFMLEQPPSV
jgi:hypothetical protein